MLIHPAKSTELNIPAIISEVVNESAAEAKREGVHLIWDSPDSEALVLGDAFKIKQAIFNLVNNAVKYNRPGGSVSLANYIEDGSVIIEVADTGIGIAGEDLPRIYDRFFRVDKSRSRQRGGSGLGLAIVKKIIEDHGGTVVATSTLGRGSTFNFTAPLPA